MPKNQEKETDLYQEVTAITSLFIGAFLLVSLISYSFPLLGSQPRLQSVAENWCGGFGYYTASYLFSFCGVISFFPSLLLFYLAVTTFTTERTFDRLPFVIAGLTGTLIAASGLLASSEQLIFSSKVILPGGYLGCLVRGLLENVLGAVGSFLLLILMLIFSLMVAVRFSPLAFLLWTWEQVPLVLESMSAGQVWLREKISCWKKERQERNEAKLKQAAQLPKLLSPSMGNRLSDPLPPSGQKKLPPLHEP
ncbi:MAG: hypothetical protein D3923_07920, partial [Candidatus Electrothrix sp. AR3]|nr:hypothetical protein [Candidatus Electrothrix sp. AR3]